MTTPSHSRCDRLWRNARLATCVGEGLGLVEDGIVAARDGRIAYAGPANGAPAFEADESIDCEGRWITPGLIDCHTHLIHAGDRAREFEMRLDGATYEEIAATFTEYDTSAARLAMIDAVCEAEDAEIRKADAAIADFLPLEGEDYEPTVAQLEDAETLRDMDKDEAPVFDEDERDELTNTCIEGY